MTSETINEYISALTLSVRCDWVEEVEIWKKGVFTGKTEFHIQLDNGEKVKCSHKSWKKAIDKAIDNQQCYEADNYALVR